MSEETLILTILITLLGGLFRGAVGFGGAMVMTLPLSLIYPPQQAIVMVLVLELVGPALIFRKSWQTLEMFPELKSLFLRASLACLLLLPFGLFLQEYLSKDLVTLSMALVVATSSLALLFPTVQRITVSGKGAALAGSLSGVMLGLTGIGGPPMVLYLLASQLEQRLVGSFLMLYVSLISLLMILVSSAYFEIPPVTLIATMALIPFFFLGAMTSSHFVRRLNPSAVRHFSLAFLLFANLVFLFNHLS